jgi:hypothetical protein
VESILLLECECGADVEAKRKLKIEMQTELAPIVIHSNQVFMILLRIYFRVCWLIRVSSSQLGSISRGNNGS